MIGPAQAVICDEARRLVRGSDKLFLLTARGIEVARELIGAAETPDDRLTKQEENEIKRITKSPAFHLFQRGEAAKLLDMDFYDYFGASVRTPKGDFLGRLTVVEEAARAHQAKINDQILRNAERITQVDGRSLSA